MGEDKIPAPDRYLDAAFGEHGYLARAFAGYRPRPGQVALARAVDRAIVGQRHLLAEGPTGTGKSLAYAVPATYHAARLRRTVPIDDEGHELVVREERKPVVIVTANIALQEQIVNKDLPLIQTYMPWKFTYALMKGRNNYLCLSRYYEHQSQNVQKKTPSESSAEEKRQLPVIQTWANTCVQEGVGIATGDMSELPFEPHPNVWRRFSVSSDECHKERCRHREECFPNAAMARARQSDVIVTNYHLLYAHLSVFEDIQIDVVLSPFEVAILDEAHKAPDIARDFFGDRVSRDTVHRLARRIHKHNHAVDSEGRTVPRDHNIAVVATNLATHTDLFFNAMAGLHASEERYDAYLEGDYHPHEIQAWHNLRNDLAETYNFFHARVLELEQEVKEAPPGDERDELNEELGRIEKDRERTREVGRHLASAMERPLTNGSRVYFLEEDEKKKIRVCSKLVRASDKLRPLLFQKHAVALNYTDRGTEAVDRGPVTVIATSATLTTEGAMAFDYLAQELGADDYNELRAESPFHYPSQCLFVVPQGMPNPNAPEFRDAVARTMERIVLLAGGRTLGLFTSRRMVEHVFDAIVGTCRKQGITLLRQGDEPRSALIARFKEDIRSVLLGTESFWAGVDVPGEACSVVAMDRLPFPNPTDPVLSIMARTDKDTFFKHSIPRAILQFKQGFGRLIRSEQCRGVVVCLDNRLETKRYGRQFLRALPPVDKTTNLDAIAEWLNPPAWDALS